MIKPVIVFFVLLSITCAGYWTVMREVHVLTDDDIFICEDSVRKCKVYVTPDTFKPTGKNSFDINVKKFFYGQLKVVAEKFSFWEDDGKIFYRADDGKTFEVAGDNSAKAIWNYGLEKLNVR